MTTYESERTALLEIFERHMTTIENTPMADDLREKLRRGEDEDFQAALELLKIEYGVAP